PWGASCMTFDPGRRAIAEGQWGHVVRTCYPGQSGLMPADLITLAHLSVSSAMSLPKSTGEPGRTVPPRSASRAFRLGSARAAFIPALSLSMISTGVFAGAPTPENELAS